MNIEEAKRALLRREEDVAWMRITQAYHRERGAVLRLLQRRQEEARREHEDELQRAEQAFNEARALQRRSAEDAAAEQRAAEREQDTGQRIAARQERERKEAKKRDAEQKRLKEVEAAERRAEQKQKERKAKEADERRRTSERQHLSRAEFNRTNSRTPHPKSDNTFGTVPSTATRAKAATPDFSPKRKIVQQTEVEDAEAYEKAAERQLLEMRRLENLIAQRRQEERKKKEAQDERKRHRELERRRQEAIERQQFEEQRHHVETILSIERDKRKRLTERVLVPLKGADGDTTYRAVSPSAAASSEALKSSHKLEQEAVERRQANDEERRAERQRHEEVLSMRNAANLEHARNLREEARRKRDTEYERDLEEAKLGRERDEEQQRLLVEQVKQEQKRQEKSVKAARAERQRQAAIQALELKMESAKLADSVEERNLQVFREKMAEADRLSKNRRLAREMELQQQRDEQKKHEAIIAESLRARQEAAKQLEAERKKTIDGNHLRLHADAQNKGRFRRQIAAAQSATLKGNEAFYASEAASKPKKARVPAQPRASAPVRLPPHPELAALERETTGHMASVEDDIAAADSQMKGLEHSRL